MIFMVREKSPEGIYKIGMRGSSLAVQWTAKLDDMLVCLIYLANDLNAS